MSHCDKAKGHIMQRHAILTFYFLAIFLAAMPYGLTFLLPDLFAVFGGDARDVGGVLAATAAMTVLIVIFSGRIAARWRRMSVIAAASLVLSLAMALFALADRMGPLCFVAGAILGVGWGLFYVLTPIALTDLITADERVRFFTLLSVFIMAGFGLSPVLGAGLLAAGFPVRAAFWVVALACLVAAVVFALLVPAFARHATPGSPNPTQLSRAAIARVMRSRAIRPVIMVGIGASVFAAVTNFQTIFAAAHGLDFGLYFAAYTITVIICRVALAEFIGGRAPYAVMAILLGIMALSIVVMVFMPANALAYALAAILFGIGYGVSYPIVKAMAANDAEPDLLAPTLELFGLSYFLGVFGFPFVAGIVITSAGIATLLLIAAGLALVECLMAAFRYRRDRSQPA